MTWQRMPLLLYCCLREIRLARKAEQALSKNMRIRKGVFELGVEFQKELFLKGLERLVFEVARYLCMPLS